MPVDPDADETALAREIEMPVVARMVVEIRSDGTKTMARGALEDLVTGQNVAIETEPMGLFELSGQLTKSLLAIPGMAARQALRDRVPAPLRKLTDRLFRRDRSDDRA